MASAVASTVSQSARLVTFICCRIIEKGYYWASFSAPAVLRSPIRSLHPLRAYTPQIVRPKPEPPPGKSASEKEELASGLY